MPAAPGSRSFGIADQESFAVLSGDRNPMHMDPVAARRTQAGACAVHGMHALLWGLDVLAANGLPLAEASGLKVEFTRFMRLDAPISAAIRSASPDRVQAELTQDGQRAVAIDLALGLRPPRTAPPPADPALPPTDPDDPDFEGLNGKSGRLAPPRGQSPEQHFPRLASTLGPDAVASLALLSTLVGMVVPGLHSIFSGLQLDFGTTGLDRGLAWRVAQADPRFRLVALDVAGASFAGTLRAFARLPPVEAPSLAAIAALVDPEEFAGRR